MKRLIIAAAVAWGLVVVGLAYYSFRTDRPTDRDQTTIAQALPTVDAALAEVATALDPAASVAVLGGYNRVGRSCSVTAAREGGRYERVLIAYTKEGTEPQLLDRVAAGLPKRYGPSVKHRAQLHSLSADAGNFVEVRGATFGPGRVRFIADTGCRPQDAPVTDATPASDTANRAPVQAVLDTLKLSAQKWRTYRATCSSGGALWTVEAVAAPPPGSLVDALGASVPATPVLLAGPQLYAYRNGPAGVVARSDDGALTVTSTTGCG